MNSHTQSNSPGPVRSLLRIPEVAERLRVGRTTIYALLQQGAPLRVPCPGRLSVVLRARSVKTSHGRKLSSD